MRFEIGQQLVAVGPNPPAGKWEPTRVTVEAIDDRGYVTSGSKQVAARIMFGCEHMWRVTS